MKCAACLIAALLLLAALATPAYAEPVTEADSEITTEWITPRDIMPIMPYDGELLEEQTEPATQATTWTTIGIVPIDEELEGFNGISLGLSEGYSLQDAMLFGALGISIVALLLAVIALARTGRRRRPGNAAGDYKKFF